MALGEGGKASVELVEQGFYSVRLQGMGDRRPFQVAVNLDPAESDLSALPPAEFVNTATGRAALAPTGADLEHPELTPADIEKKQSLWWFLFVAGAAALLGEAILANRLSKRFGFGLLQTQDVEGSGGSGVPRVPGFSVSCRTSRNLGTPGTPEPRDN